MNIEKLRKKQQKLMAQMVERKVRSRAQQLYDERGRVEGQDLDDWYQAESEVLGNSILAPLYRRLRVENANETETAEGLALRAEDTSASENPV